MNLNRLKVSVVKHSCAKPANYHKKGSEDTEAFQNATLTVLCEKRLHIPV